MVIMVTVRKHEDFVTNWHVLGRPMLVISYLKSYLF